jgi:indolepyruvate ferredoxin oxidoreductase alpha subunit
MADIDVNAPGTTELLMGNEAIARGALEGGLGFAAAYPGTPSSEILPTIAGVAKRNGIYAEWSVNEMVAMETATGASLGGIRAMAIMKQNGVNVASDFLSNLVMRSIGAGLILVSVDDPTGRNSSGEEDTRPISKWLDIPMLEPGDFQEAKDMTKWLFDLSEQVDCVCMLRSVSKISHTRGNVILGEIPEKKLEASFNIGGGGPRGIHAHALLHQKLKKAQELFESSPFNKYVGPDKPELLIVTCGSGWFYSQEAVKVLKLEDKVGILKIGTLWPLPDKFVAKHLKKADKVLVVEEIDPFLERSVMELAANLKFDGSQPVFYGKRSGHIADYGEQMPDSVIKAITEVMGISYQSRPSEYAQRAKEVLESEVIARSGTVCPGCPHKASFWSIKNALRLDGRYGFVTGDIGCYTVGLSPAGYSVTKTHYCMGGGIGVANGLGKLGQFGFNQPVVAACGDSTFFHAAIPGLVNGVYNNSNFILAVFDNSATAMTGFQPHAGTGVNAMGDPARKVSIEAVCRAIGARVEVCDPFDLDTTRDILLELMEDEGSGPRVVIMERECELQRARREDPPYRVYIDPEKCLGEDCGCDLLCSRIFLCTGLRYNPETGKSEIDDIICAGCGVCADVCPHGAIIREPYVTEKKELAEGVGVK